MINLNDQFIKAKMVAQKLENAGAIRSLIVGGWVRDYLLGIQSKDLDIEVYGLNYAQIISALAGDFRVNLVGESFGVVKVDNEIDVSIPRSESKIGVGHKGFDVHVDPNMTVAEAAVRRDYTVNSIAMSFDGNFFDPFNGRADINNQLLRACSPAFKEDPLRVLRGMQFAARFDFAIDPKTVLMCKQLIAEYETIPKERLFNEWQKWALKGVFPKRGLDLLCKTTWIQKYPALQAMVDTPQDSIWHPEGNVFVHTGHVCDVAADIAVREELEEADRLILLFAALCHDMGKASATIKNEDGRWIAPKHADIGVPLAADFLTRISAPKWLIESVNPLVKEHMAHVSHQNDTPSDRTIRRLANRLGPSTIRLWSMVCESDASGRPPLPKKNPVEDWVAAANSLAIKNAQPKPILMGRHLLDLGVEPGKEMGRILHKAFECQLDGVFDDLTDAINWAKANLMSTPADSGQND